MSRRRPRVATSAVAGSEAAVSVRDLAGLTA